MSFNTALIGLKAAAIDLQVTGNNIANASTVGFKRSRAEFGDVYAQTTLGLASSTPGSGVIVQEIAQQFQQGSVTFTDNSLDLAITGNGFFIVSNQGEPQYTRAGTFGLDQDGFIVSNSNARLQGFIADDLGNVGGVLGDLQVVQSVQQPRQTTMVEMSLNLDASEPVLSRIGTTFSSLGAAIGVPQVGLADPTTTSWSSVGVPRALGNAAMVTADDVIAYGGGLTINDASDNNELQVTLGGTTTTLTIADGTYTNDTELASAINYAIVSAGLGNQLAVSVNGANQLEFETQGLSSVDGTALSIATVDDTFTDLGWNTFTTVAPSTGAEIAHPAGFDFQSVDGSGYTIESAAGAALATGIIASDAGTQSELGGSVVLGFPLDDLNAPNGTYDFSGANGFSFTLFSGATSDTYTVNTDLETFNQAALLNYINTTLIAGSNLDGVLTAVDNGMGGIAFRNDNPGNERIYVSSATTSAGTGDSVTTVFGVSVGYAAGDEGNPVVQGNNEFAIELTGTYNVGPITLTLNENKTYNDMADVADEIQDLIDAEPLLAGRIEASAIGSRIRLMHDLASTGEQILITDIPGNTGGTNLGLVAPNIVDLGSAPETRNAEFRITMSNSDNELNNGSIIISLDRNITSVTDLADEINSQINTAAEPIGVQAVATLNSDGNYQLEFVAIDEGEGSVISVDAVRAVGTAISDEQVFSYLQFDEDQQSIAGIAAVDNGYPAQSVEIVDSEGNEAVYVSPEGATAAETASALSRYSGISATATTTAVIPSLGYENNSGDLVISLNGVDLVADSLDALVLEINDLSATSLIGFSAVQDAASGDVTITHQTGQDIAITIDSTNTSDALTIQGPDAADEIQLSMLGGDRSAVVGGTLDFVLDEGVSISNPTPVITGLFGRLDDTAFTPFELNGFDPNDQGTYNHSTSLEIYDSAGVPHIMTQYFVKDRYDPTDPLLPANAWTMYVQIDGQNVGDPDPNLPPPQNAEPTMASFALRFDADGSLNADQSDEILISNWTPLDADGNPSGALAGQPVLDGGILPIPQPPISSNFGILFNDSTQFGAAFSINDVDQDGFTTGRLSSVDIDAEGIMFARFTNGQSQILGQLALAGFNNVQGMEAVGDTAWVETFDSGEPIIGAAGTSALGNINAGALEESNVDLSAQLVRLIIAQRNFQANAKTIETANQITQSILNI